MTPTTEQQNILDFTTTSTSNLMINALAGCIATGTFIRLRRGNDKTVRNVPIERIMHQRKPEIPTLIQCDIGGRVDYIPMIGCMFSGVKRVMRLETEFGEVLATPDHEFKTTSGYRRLDEIKIKEEIFTRTPYSRGRSQGRITVYSVQHHPYAYAHNIGEYGNYKRIHRARLVVEAHMNKLTLEDMITIVRHDPYRAAKLTYLPDGVEVHHKDEDVTNDDYFNLEVLTAEEHRRQHEMHLNHTWLGTSAVVSITDAGERYTYDIAMPSPYHNFLANGHVVHNCGKSATLKMIDRTNRTKPALYLVFNKRNADEARKSGDFADTTTIKTFNAIGHGIWANAITKPINLDKAKSRTLWREMLETFNRTDTNDAWRCYHVVMDGLEKAKSLGYVPTAVKYPHKSLIDRRTLHHSMDERPDEYAAQLIDQLLTESINKAYSGLIDFNDQIYMPALFGGTFPKFPRVMVDEYQDQSPINHALLEKLVKGRIIGVGDPFQNIYGFRGAKAGGMKDAVGHYSMTELPLSVSFRCPSEIVKAAQWRVPHFQWSKEGGNVTTTKDFDSGEFVDDTTIICRNNAPLLRLAFKLISAGRSVNVVGSELGPRLVGIIKKLGPASMNRAEVCSAIEQWREDRLMANSKSANDLADCMRVFAEHGNTLSSMISYAEHLFKQQGTIRLLTGHKSKGLEFQDVFWLDPHLCDDREQDRNLAYVIQTRSQNNLTMLDSDTIRW